MTTKLNWRRADKPYEFAKLATFNAERARGIVHTPEWCALMAKEQERFYAQMRSEPGVMVFYQGTPP